MINSFDSLPWHDAKILGIFVDRRNPGKRDEIRLLVVWPQGDKEIIVFRECYAMVAEMNFGIISDELIDSAVLIKSDSELSLITNKWDSLGVSLEDLNCYLIQTSSTGGLIRIYANKFEVKPYQKENNF